MQPPRTLPLRVPLQHNESLYSWLLRLSLRNGVAMLHLAQVLGFGQRLQVPHNYTLSWRLPPQLLRRIETQTGLPAGTLDATVLDQFDALGWKPIPGSRYCTACLTETGGVWNLRWQLPHTFACLTHQLLLTAVCPRCHRAPHSSPGLTLRAGQRPTTQCVLGTRRAESRCEADLLDQPLHRLRGTDIRLTVQRWVDDRLDRMDGQAVTDLRDLDALVTWFRRCIEPAELIVGGKDTIAAMTDYRRDNHGVKRAQVTAPLIAAALAVQAHGLLTADDQHRYQRLRPLLRDVHTQYRPERPTSISTPRTLSRKRLEALSAPLRRTFLTTADSRLLVTERLRYRTCTPTPRLPEPACTTAAERSRHIPQRLWPEWVIRFTPTAGSRSTVLATEFPLAMLIPGNPVRNIRQVSELGQWKPAIGNSLSTAASRFPNLLTALCNLAEYLDTQGSPIDYRRRRETFTSVELSPQQWEAICLAADAHPGTVARLLNARRHLFQTLTGADLNNPAHELVLPTSRARVNYLTWRVDMATALRNELHRHAAGLLAAAGIHEPLTWNPPGECAAGLRLPGREPDDIDTDRLHALVADGAPPRTIAQRLGVSVEHARYAIQQLHHPTPKHPSNSPVMSRKNRARASILLSREFFERENVESGKNIDTLVNETGLPKKIIADYARQIGFTFFHPTAGKKIKVPRARRGDLIDPTWLVEQAGTLYRTNDDIAANSDYEVKPSAATGGATASAAMSPAPAATS